jgi:ribosome hibernation promoting factor
MRLELTGRHVDITPALRRLVTAKIAKTERMLKDGIVSGQVVLTREKHSMRSDVTLHARGDRFLHGVGSAGSWEASIGVAIDKIAQQAEKVKTRWKSRKMRVKGALLADVEPPPEAPRAEKPAAAARRVRPGMPRILKTTRQTIKPMSVADAARQIAGDGDIVIFHDAERDRVSVLYRRDGELTLVETEA